MLPNKERPEIEFKHVDFIIIVSIIFLNVVRTLINTTVTLV